MEENRKTYVTELASVANKITLGTDNIADPNFANFEKEARILDLSFR